MKTIKDHSWQRGGGEDSKLFALYPVDRKENGHVIWRFRCDCGRIKDLSADQVYRRIRPVRSCGECLKKFRDYSWQRGAGDGNRLFALYPTGESNADRNSIWVFRCDCGNIKEMPASYAFRNDRPISSCGCLAAENEFGKHQQKMTLEERQEEHRNFTNKTKDLADQGYKARSIYVDGKLVKRYALG